MRPFVLALALLFALPLPNPRAAEEEPLRCATRSLVEKVRSTQKEKLEALEGALFGAAAFDDACRKVVRARLLLAAGKFAEAARLLESAAGELGDVRGYLEALRASALLYAGDAPGARALVLAGLAGRYGAVDDALRERLLLLEADTYLAEGAYAKVVKTHRRLLKERIGDRAALRANLGRALLALGKEEEGRRVLLALLVEDPGHPIARRVERRLDEGELLLTPKQLERRIEALLKASRFTRAADEAIRAAEALPRRSVEREPLEVLAVTALVRAGRTTEALARAQSLVEGDDAPFSWRKVHAWALGKAGEHALASAAWDAVEKSAPNKEEAAEACFFAGFFLYEAGRTRDARTRLFACNERVRGTRWEVPALWYRALLALFEGDAQDAAALLHTLIQAAPRDREVTKHRYWLARARELEGKGQEARRILRSLAAAFPTDYYGMLARARLGKAPVEGADVPADALERLAERTPSPKVELLYALGFDDAARALASKGHTRADLGLSQRVGDAHRAWRHGARHLPRPPVKGDRLVASPSWRASYAMPWRSLVEEAARRHGVDPAFAYAIMRTESGFLPSAKSPAGALGLMQLMPYTGRGIAERLGRPAPRPADLMRPEISIELGIAFLALAEDELGHTLLAAAAYNGGLDNVVAWMRAFGSLEPELFVERIPFKETRDYVKSVLQARAIYRALQGAPLQLDLPAGPVGPGPERFTWFPPSEGAELPQPGAEPPYDMLSPADLR